MFCEVLCCVLLLQLGAGFKKFNIESCFEHPADTEENRRLGKSTEQEPSTTQIQRRMMEFVIQSND